MLFLYILNVALKERVRLTTQRNTHTILNQKKICFVFLGNRRRTVDLYSRLPLIRHFCSNTQNYNFSGRIVEVFYAATIFVMK